MDNAHLWVVFDEEGVGVMGPFGFGSQWFDVTVIVYGDGRTARYEGGVLIAPPPITHGVRTSRLSRSTGESDIQSINIERVSAFALVRKSGGFSLYEDLLGLDCYRQLSDPDFWGCVEE